MKRFFDFFVALIGLIILLPFFIIIAILIYKNDGGPVFFKQKRIGKFGKFFIIFKFRSMSVIESAKEGVFELGNISRITSVGRLLRKTKLDELPQLINVLKGEMSIVGPRPEVEKWVSVYPERWQKVLSVKPGITDNASILFRSEESILAKSDNPELTYKEIILPKKLEFYEDYVVNHSFFGDLKLIFKTIFYISYKN
jgi:lipopolysaccharide/colanic/teichoic acid biosynthesis glycosyltransferase